MKVPTKHYEISEYEYLNFLIVGICDDVFTGFVFDWTLENDWTCQMNREELGLGVMHYWQREKHVQRCWGFIQTGPAVKQKSFVIGASGVWLHE